MKVTNNTRRLFTFNVLADPKSKVVDRIRFLPGETTAVPKKHEKAMQKDKFFLAHLAEKNLSAEGFSPKTKAKDKEKEKEDGYNYVDEETFLGMNVNDIRSNAKHLDAAQLSECISAEEVKGDEGRPSVVKALNAALKKFG